MDCGRDPSCSPRSARSRCLIDYNAREGITPGESHVLLLFATSGMMILAAARDLIIVFLGIEIMSVAVYVLVGMNRRSERSAEGAIKYFLLGAFSTGVSPLRHRARVRRDGRHEPLDHRRERSPSSDLQREPAAVGRGRSAARRVRIQGRRCPIPHVGARRVRGRADTRLPRTWPRR